PLSPLCPSPPRPAPLSLHDALPISDLALAGRDALDGVGRALATHDLHVEALVAIPALLQRRVVRHVLAGRHEVENERVGAQRRADRKSTRLNSSHQIISYAVFCLKK